MGFYSRVDHLSEVEYRYRHNQLRGRIRESLLEAIRFQVQQAASHESLSSLLSILLLLWKHFAAQVKYWQKMREPNSLHDREQCKVPSADDAKHTKPSSNPKQMCDVLQIRGSSGRGYGEVRCSNEGEEEYKANEDQGKEYVNAESAD